VLLQNTRDRRAAEKVRFRPTGNLAEVSENRGPAAKRRDFSSRNGVLTGGSFLRQQSKWRKRVGVEPTGDRIACHPPVLKTGTITGPHALPFAAPCLCAPMLAGELVYCLGSKAVGPKQQSVPYGTSCTYQIGQLYLWL